MSERANHKRSTVEKATDEFLRVLRQRNASVHTIKAYAGDLENFASYVGTREWKSIDHVAIRGFLSHLYEKGLSKAAERADRANEQGAVTAARQGQTAAIVELNSETDFVAK